MTANQWFISFLEKVVVLRINLLQTFLKEVFTPSITLLKHFPIRWLSRGNTSLKAFQASVHQKFTWILFSFLKKSFTVLYYFSPRLALIFRSFEHNKHIVPILFSSCFGQNCKLRLLILDGRIEYSALIPHEHKTVRLLKHSLY